MRNSRLRHASAASAVAVLASVLAVSGQSFTGAPLAGNAFAADASSITLKAPNHATVGDVVMVEVSASAPRPIAAFEITATIDPNAGRIEGAETRLGESAGVADLSIADLTGYAVLAAYTPAGVPVRRGPKKLGHFVIRLDSPGVIEIRVGAGQYADVDGVPVPLTDPVPVRIAVSDKAGRAPTEPVFPAPPLPWSLAADTSGPNAWPTTAVDAELDWQSSRLAKDPCAATLATEAGGCLSSADLQLLATNDQFVQTATAETPAAAAASSTFVVNTLSDTWDSNVGNGICSTAAGVCSLRAAMQEANAVAGPNSISFAVPGPGPFRINLFQRLPPLTDTSGGTTIDGYTQPGATPNTDPLASNATIMIEIVGAGSTSFDGIVLNSNGNVIRGLSIYNLRRPIWIYRSGTSTPGNAIIGDFVGTDPTGTFGHATEVDVAHGINIEQDSANTIIGGTNPADRNVISGNARHGIGIWHSFSDNTVIYGNIIGLSPGGDRALPNKKHGVDFNFGVSSSILGGTAPGQRNVISGNGDSAVEISHTSATTGNVVAGNFLGTNLNGTGAPAYTANGNTGVYVEDGVLDNVIENNVIGNNLKGGIRILNGGSNGVSTGTIVRGNRIGVSLDGTAIPNGQVGVSVDGSDSIIGPGNIIANNTGGGIISSETDALRNTFTRNSILANTGLSIDLAPLTIINPNDVGDADTGPNDLLNRPVFTAATDQVVAGTACAGCTVEIYSTGVSGGGGSGNGPPRTFVTTAAADGNGDFSLSNGGTFPLGGWITATATDPSGNTSEPADNVRVDLPNRPPTVDAGADFTIDEGASRTLTASGSDPDGDPLAYSWDLDGDGSFERAGNPVTYVAPNIGPASVTISVQATDGRGGIAVDSLVATINDVPPPPQPPRARFTMPPEITAGDPLTLALADAFDPDSTQALQYSFNCGGGYGAWSSTASTTCGGLAAGPRVVSGRVRDASGLSTEYTATAFVHANLVQNGSFESGSGGSATGWTLSNLARQSTVVRDGGFALVNTGTGNALAKQAFQIGDLHMLQSGAVSIPAQAGSVSVVERVRWYDANGGLISTRSSPPITGPTNGWIAPALDLTVPVGAATAVAEYAWTVSGSARAYLDDVAVTNVNQLLNPDFEADADGDGRPDTWWNLSRFTRSSAEAHLGTFSGQASSDGTAFTPGQKVSKVVAGQQYQIATWLNVPAASNGVTVRVTVRWLAAGSNNTISAPLLTTRSGSTPGWVQIGGTLTAPAGASFAYLEIRFVSLVGDAYLDTAYFGRT